MPQLNDEIYSNEMQEIIGQIPSWLTRWGTFVLTALLGLAIYLSAEVKYPDILNADVLVQAKEQPGKVVLTKNDASQEFFFKVKEKQTVKKGDTLLVYTDNKSTKINPVITPMAGTIFISKGIDEKNTQDIVVWVVPKVQTYDVKIKFSKKGAGRVKAGQEVIIHLDNYPEDEFGFVEGSISSILPVSVDDNTSAYINLKQGLKTNVGKTLPIEHILQGNAEILLTNKSIFSRIFGGILSKLN